MTSERTYEVIPSEGVPIKAWTRGVPIEEEAARQLRNVARLPFIHRWVAAMPDVHWGIGATVGSVIPTVGAVIPAAVGVDIGCGMMAVQTTLTANDLPESLREVRTAIERAVPHGWAPRGRAPRANLAANLAERAGAPALDLVVALDAHGTHVAGIAGANDLYGVSGFDGVAPGAQLLALKISNRANGSVSGRGSIVAALDHAIRFAAARRQPLVINLSFGVGNEREGEARIDRLIDSVLAEHPALPLVVHVHSRRDPDQVRESGAFRVLEGELNELIEALIAEDQAERLAEVE